MKIRKIAAFAIALVMMIICIPSCANVVTVNDVRFSALTEDVEGNLTLLCGTLTGTVTGTEENPPTVLDAAIAILEQNGINYRTDGTSITSIKSKSETSRNGYLYVWVYTINGEEPKDARAYEIPVQESDVIVYYLRPEEDTSGNSVNDETDENGETVEIVETEAPEETEESGD